MCRSAGAGDDDLDTTGLQSARVFARACRGPMRRRDVDFVSNAEFGQRLRGLVHDIEVGVAAHDDGDKRFVSHNWDYFTSLVFLGRLDKLNLSAAAILKYQVVRILIANVSRDEGLARAQRPHLVLA